VHYLLREPRTGDMSCEGRPPLRTGPTDGCGKKYDRRSAIYTLRKSKKSVEWKARRGWDMVSWRDNGSNSVWDACQDTKLAIEAGRHMSRCRDSLLISCCLSSADGSQRHTERLAYLRLGCHTCLTKTSQSARILTTYLPVGRMPRLLARWIYCPP
jgi:hypothetical protein